MLCGPVQDPLPWRVLVPLKYRSVVMKPGAREARGGGRQSLGALPTILEKYIEKLQIGGFYRKEP